jgi:hypothetical protein
VSFAVITLCVASQRAIQNVKVYLVIDSVQKLLDTSSYVSAPQAEQKINLIFLTHQHIFIVQEITIFLSCVEHS